MNENIIIRKATIRDINFLVDTIVAAEKSGTNIFGLARLFELSESEMRHYLKIILEEEIDGCEFSVSSFLVAELNGIVISAFAGWMEGLNEDEMPSALLKSNLISYYLPTENVLKSKSKSNIVNPLQIDREIGTYQLEYSYTIPSYQSKGIMGAIIDTHINQAVTFGAKRMQLHVFENNIAALKTYKKRGFIITKRYESNNKLTSKYFPFSVLLLMEKELN